MAKQLTEDQTLTHSIVNLLNAGFQGMYAFANILQQFNHPAYSEDLQKNIESKLDRISGWMDDIYRGAELFSVSWESPKTFEASDALAITNELGADTIYTANLLRSMLSSVNPVSDPSNLIFMVAAYGRVAYIKENFLRGLDELGKYSENEEIQKRTAQSLSLVADEVKQTHWMINQLASDQGLTPRFTSELLLMSFNTVPAMYTQVHDLNQLTAQFKGGLNGENLGFTKEEEKLWAEARIPPVPAGYWRAHLFGPNEAIAWTAAGIGLPINAFQWKLAGFTPEESAIWTSSNLHPQVAKFWKDAGYDPQTSADFVKQGITDPTKVPK